MGVGLWGSFGHKETCPKFDLLPFLPKNKFIDYHKNLNINEFCETLVNWT